ncbi:hypothetical protein [Janthinobacterium tructae]|uniref:hypothetical protein n=1 Tax=Janthinobacterium tructae TaxID=2590869 RepID=UPI00249BA10C|nr:hypothetical protein [Janthinobacterium tructae]MDI3294185.1 hypothetical protein [Janthinobacterium tructae]
MTFLACQFVMLMGRYRPKTDADVHIFRFTEGNIKTLARTIIFATHYIDSRAGDASDEDVAALEEISAELKKSSVEEKNCLIQTAKELGLESWLDEMGID